MYSQVANDTHLSFINIYFVLKERTLSMKKISNKLSK